MALTFDQFFSAIAEQESNGRYGAVGAWVRGNRAYGKYQVMDFNIPSWTRQYYGKSLTPQQFLNNPKAQEAVARGKLKSYWNKYGARGAAAAWYSGDASLHMSTRSQSGGPSIKSYVDSVLSKAGGYPAGGGTSAGVPYASTGAVKPKLSMAELAEQYGFTSAMLKATPELKNLFSRMVSEGWNEAKFKAKLRETKWWKTKPEKERQYLTLRFTDPATAKQQLEQAKVKIRQMAAGLGLSGKAASAANINSYAYKMVALGWDEAQLRNAMGAKITLSSAVHSGEAGQAWDEFHEYAYSMGVKLSDGWAARNARGIVRGTTSMQTVKNEIARLAKAQFPQWAKQIDGGQTVFDIAQPYLSSMSQILELPAGSINLFDPTVKSTLNWVNPSTLKKEAKPLWQFENELRSDPRWKKTKNAQDSLMGVAHQVLADFGLKY